MVTMGRRKTIIEKRIAQIKEQVAEREAEIEMARKAIRILTEYEKELDVELKECEEDDC